jgi:23S rRNA (cytosine1962-C5)-methyltransferase
MTDEIAPDAALARFDAALEARLPRLSGKHEVALRLFNGYTEGFPRLAVDVYGATLVVYDATAPDGSAGLVDAVVARAREKLPWLNAGLCKVRESAVQTLRNGSLLFGEEKQLARKVREDGVWYAVRLTLNRDSSLYLDTAPLRAWAKASLAGKRVLNTFSYTGSLGAAAKAGGAARVVNTDLNPAFLTVAKDTWALNGWPVARPDFITGDFFDVVGRLKREKQLFDCVFIDPPFFSVTSQGRVDLETDMLRVVNKVRPLVADGGALVLINNGVFVSGATFDETLTAVCGGGYAEVEQRLLVPEDFAGHAGTRTGVLPADPAPWNHSTKVAVLRLRRKDGRAAADPKPKKVRPPRQPPAAMGPGPNDESGDDEQPVEDQEQVSLPAERESDAAHEETPADDAATPPVEKP